MVHLPVLTKSSFALRRSFNNENKVQFASVRLPTRFVFATAEIIGTVYGNGTNMISCGGMNKYSGSKEEYKNNCSWFPS